MICKNAHEPQAWYCYHFAGRITSGKEAVNANDRCEACEIANPPYEEEPSFLRNEE